MGELKRTQLYDIHVQAGATLVDFGGWEMPIQYPEGIVTEHLYTRQVCGLFDVSHMGRLLIEGPQRKEFLQHVLTSNVDALELNLAQYCMIPNENGGAVDDAYLYMFSEERYLLVVNAANTDKDLAHLNEIVKDFDCTITNITDKYAAIAVQGPKSKEILTKLNGGVEPTEPMKNALNTIEIEGRTVRVAMTGYTGEPIGYEVYVASEDAEWMWNNLVEMGGHPAGLGARDTLRLEAGMPLYGHELGADIEGNEIPIYAVSLAKFAVSFAAQKGDFVGRAALEKQHEAFMRYIDEDFSDMSALPKRMMPIVLTGKGVIRAGMEVYKGDKHVGWITSGTIVPYFQTEGEGLATVILETTAKRSIGFAYIDSDIITDDEVEVAVRGKRVKAVIPPCHMSAVAPPYARTLLYGVELETKTSTGSYVEKAINILNKVAENQDWRQRKCINLIPSENTPSKAVSMLCGSDASGRYAEHKKVTAFYDKDIFYYQGTKLIDDVEQMLVQEMRQYFGCTEVETRVTSGQMANMAVFSALMDWKNRADRKVEPKRLGYVMNNHIIKGGHLSAQPMGALHDYIAIDPITEKPALVNFPICADNPYKMDVEETKKLLVQHKPELIIFGKSMVLHKEPVAEIRQFLDDQKINTTIMYDMAHVLGLIGDHFQKPFEEGAEIVTGSTHKTFFGPQRGLIGVNYKEDELKYGLWETIERRTFPGSVSNHHLGTQLGMLMAAYEMNAFKDEYQKNVVENAKFFAKALKAEGLDVEGDPAIDYTETHQVIVSVGYGEGPEIAERLEANDVIVNYQATPAEEGFTASGALRLGVNEMTRFGFGKEEFAKVAQLMADCILRGKEIREDVNKLREGFTEMKYCFTETEVLDAMGNLSAKLGM